MNSISTIEKWRKSKILSKYIGIKGVVISMTTGRYIVALAKMENRINMLLQVVDESSNIKINDKVLVVLRRVKIPNKSEVVQYGHKFKKIVK